MDILIIAAAGESSRMKSGVPKIFLEVAGTTVLARALEPARRIRSIGRLVVAVREEDAMRCREALDRLDFGDAEVVAGGASRAESINNALKSAGPCGGLVVVHDGARPFATEGLWRRVMSAARKHGAAIPGLPVTDTLKAASDGVVKKTVPRDGLVAVQTPQAFGYDIFAGAYARLGKKIASATDDASIVEAAGHEVFVVAGEKNNIKITYKEDIKLAEYIAAAEE